MADYLRNTILSQGYVHIEGIRLNAEERKAFEVNISQYQKPRAAVLIGMEIVPQVRTEDGSLKVYSTVFGSLADALGDFTEFLPALNQLYGSSKMLADACNLESLFWSKAKKKAMIRSEARTGVVRATKDICDRLHYLIEGERRDSHAKITSQLAELEGKFVSLNQQFTFGRDKELVWGEIIPLMKKLSSTIYRAQATPDEEKVKIYKNTISSIVRVLEKYSAEGDRVEQVVNANDL
jgi:hypothetical protein